MTARDALVHSCAQSRKLDRKSCGMAGMSRSLSNFESVLLLSGFPMGGGNTKPLSPASACASRRTCTVRSDNGTRCSRLAFVRSVGTVHTLASKSISSHVAGRTSSERAAVRIKNSKASLVIICAWEPCTVCIAAGTSQYGERLLKRPSKYANHYDDTNYPSDRSEDAIPLYTAFTHRLSLTSSVHWVYPRVCGGTHAIIDNANGNAGLSPRVRGNLIRTGAGSF